MLRYFGEMTADFEDALLVADIQLVVEPVGRRGFARAALQPIAEVAKDFPPVAEKADNAPFF